MNQYLSLLKKVGSAKLVAVTKKRSVDEIQELYDLGCRDFGENRIPEALEKKAALPKDIRWHFIGALQSKKASKASGEFELIHSVDTPKLLSKLPGNKVLLQVNCSGELSKQGLSPEEWLQLFPTLLETDHVQGLMTMAPLTEDESLIRSTFSRLREFRDLLEREFNLKLPELSMGMSRDWQIALDEGATLLRIGSALFPDME